jgi:Domain of unknown function (DUF4136)
MTTGDAVPCLCLGWKYRDSFKQRRKVEMKKLAFLVYLLIALVLLMFGVAGVVTAQDVRYDFDKNKDFSKYKTYKWVPIKGADQPDALTAQKLTAAVDAELATKGLTKTDSDTADLYIGYQTAIGTEKQFTSYNTGWGYGPGWGGGWYGGGGMTSNTTYGSTSTVYIGQLDLSMYDPADKQIVWRGTASKTLDPKAKPEKKEKNIGKAVNKLLKNYPPPVKK